MPKRIKIKIASAIIITLTIALTTTLCIPSQSFALERRRNQSPTSPGYIVMPYAMSMPGIGDFYGFAAVVENLYETEADFMFANMAGALQGFTASLQDIPIVNEIVTLNYLTTKFTKAGIDTYGRGMNSDPDKSQFIMMDKTEYSFLMLNFKAWEKRFQIYLSQGQGAFHLDYILDKDGNRYDITTSTTEMKDTEMGLILDYTDDRNDPRKGIRFEGRNSYSPRKDAFNCDFSRLDMALTGYIPVGERDVWAFNVYTSSALVKSTGEIDPALIESRLNIQCSGDAQCIAERNTLVEQTRLANLNGTASSLGGTMFLRAFPQGRFQGAHASFMGTEYRWNFSEQSEPFDIFMAKGVQTSMQLAFFTERGTVAETRSELGKTWAHSTGVGLRVTLQTGMTFRFDVATGEEGPQTTLFFNYPWGVFN